MPSVEIRPDTERRPYPFLLVLLVLMICLIGCESGEYNDKAHQLIDSIETVLISENLCKDTKDCNSKQYVLYALGKGINIFIYGITDTGIINKIVETVIQDHKKNPAISYDLTIYSITKDEDYKKSKPKKTLLHLTLPKEE
jgi:hypothetical protein